MEGEQGVRTNERCLLAGWTRHRQMASVYWSTRHALCRGVCGGYAHVHTIFLSVFPYLQLLVNIVLADTDVIFHKQNHVFFSFVLLRGVGVSYCILCLDGC